MFRKRFVFLVASPIFKIYSKNIRIYEIIVDKIHGQFETKNTILRNPKQVFIKSHNFIFYVFLREAQKYCTFKKLNMPSFFARTEIDCVISLSNGGLKGNPEAADTSIGRSCNGEMKEIRTHLHISFT